MICKIKLGRLIHLIQKCSIKAKFKLKHTLSLSPLPLSHSAKKMEWKATETVRAKMESLRLICDRDAQIQLQKMDSFTASFSNSMDSVKARAEETVQNQGQKACIFTLLQLASIEARVCSVVSLGS